LHVSIAEIIGEDKDNIRFTRRVGGVERYDGSQEQGGQKS
jgi:hypothetical protein